MTKFKITLNKIEPIYYLYMINIISVLCVVGSLYYSEIEKLPPCDLCWYQRIFMYPIAFLSTIAIFSKDLKIFKYILALAIPGLIIAAYHVALQSGIIPHGLLLPCSTTVPCTEVQVEYFGFLTIPVMSLGAFAAIVIASIENVFKFK